MKGYAKIFTEKISNSPLKDYAGQKESTKRSYGERRLIELQQLLEKTGVPYETSFGLDCVEVRWGNGVENDSQ